MPANVDPAVRETSDIAEVVRRLTLRFPDVPVAQVRTAVEHAHHGFQDARIRDFVPVFVERTARDTLASRRVA